MRAVKGKFDISHPCDVRQSAPAASFAAIKMKTHDHGSSNSLLLGIFFATI